jgi:hypothetical protein
MHEEYFRSDTPSLFSFTTLHIVHNSLGLESLRLLLVDIPAMLLFSDSVARCLRRYSKIQNHDTQNVHSETVFSAVPESYA